MTRPSPTADQIELFASEPKLPPGFVYRDDVITATEERALVEQIAQLPFKPFEFYGYLGNRRIVSFGWRYDYGARVVHPATPIPSFLLPLRERAARFAGLAPKSLEHILVTEYPEGCRHWLASRQSRIRGCNRGFAARAVRAAVSPQTRHGLGARLAARQSALGLSSARPGAERMGTQHPGARPAALFRDLPQPHRVTGTQASLAR